MNVRSMTAIALATVVVISLVSIWFYPSIQDFMRANPFWNGLRGFSREFDAPLVDSLSDISRSPENKTLIAIPYVQYKQDELDQLQRFVESGGLLVLMDDYGYGNSLLERMGSPARFSGSLLLDPLFSYKNERMPRVTDFHPDVVEAGIKAIVLNHGTALMGVDLSQALAWSSGWSFLDMDENGVPDEGEPRGPFVVAAASRRGNGIMLLLTDPSILTNSMVGKDNNRVFLEYLVNRYGPGRQMSIDASHLPRTPLDESKLRLSQARERIAHPYSVIAILGIVISLVLRTTLRREQIEHG